MNKNIPCPICSQVEPVEKVSTLYLKGIGLKEKGEGKQAAQVERHPSKPTAAMRELSHKLAPPAGGPAGFTRPVNPDFAILAFSAVLPIFLYGIWTSQRALAFPVLAIMAVFYGLFFWQRKRLVARYQQDLASRQASEDRVKKGIERWMRLYYCAEDEVVFEPGRGEPVQVGALRGFLMQQE